MAINKVTSSPNTMLYYQQLVDAEKKLQPTNYYENLDSAKYAKIGLGIGLVSGFFSGSGEYLLAKIQGHYAYNSFLLWGNTLKEKTLFILKDLLQDAESAYLKDKKASQLRFKKSFETLLKKTFPDDFIIQHINMEKEAAKLQKIIRNKRIANIILFGLAFFLATYYTCEYINKKNG